ncbi:hypothetical protein [Lacticaseibacillus sp. GG6-2]
MNKKWQQMVQNSANQSSAAGSGGYWLGSAVVALAGGGYVVYRLWDKYPAGAVVAALIFVLIGVYDLRMVLAKRHANRRRR